MLNLWDILALLSDVAADSCIRRPEQDHGIGCGRAFAGISTSTGLSFVERLVGYILQFVTRGMCAKLATIGQSDYESELVRANAGPMKFNLHLARDHSQLALLAPNDDGEAQEAQPRLVLFVEW
jgi:hypothetical protein